MGQKRESRHILVQREGRKRDLNTCQICGSTIKPEGHHIIDFFFGGSADTDNIITLCRKCHRKVHKGDIDLYKF